MKEMKNLIAGMLFLSLAVVGAAEPVEPAPASSPEPVVTSTTTQSSQPAPEAKPQVKEELRPAPKPADEDKSLPKKNKKPLEIKWIDF
jgi:hypothetical protein